MSKWYDTLKYLGVTQYAMLSIPDNVKVHRDEGRLSIRGVALFANKSRKGLSIGWIVETGKLNGISFSLPSTKKELVSTSGIEAMSHIPYMIPVFASFDFSEDSDKLPWFSHKIKNESEKSVYDEYIMDLLTSKVYGRTRLIDITKKWSEQP